MLACCVTQSSPRENTSAALAVSQSVNSQPPWENPRRLSDDFRTRVRMATLSGEHETTSRSSRQVMGRTLSRMWCVRRLSWDSLAARPTSPSGRPGLVSFSVSFSVSFLVSFTGASH